ncbi:signal peptidase I [Calidifontibacter sp. DB0510]|uniref:Signal peptidase I n=1 Tax=Metallococcus carri TaxID=1656884 RepID=A0A967AZ38_9MICO|nr:signal peptidase I [Metallococcus carri]NHN54388.1 signal peptidase I [Metallococcus carri]NOP36773.1 signal peptidase I [Calidifontibacter sp. DB2511S]
MTGGASSSEGAPPSRLRRPAFAALLVVALVAVLHGIVVETFTVPSSSMEPTLRPGDRIVVLRHTAIHRGDLVVFDAGEAFRGSDGGGGVLAALGFHPGRPVYVKRVVGMPGDRVSADSRGVLRINGRVQPEPYLSPRGAKGPPFDTTVPAGRYFVLGDRRADSDDSRNHLGDPGGGGIRQGDVIGVATWRYWPTSSWGRLGP